jgi:hypothetical protein
VDREDHAPTDACRYVQNFMKLRTYDIETLVYRPDDGNFSSAVKIVHHPSGSEYICDEFESQIKNRRVCISELIKHLSTKYPEISLPKYMLFDSVRALPPNTERQGIVRELIWHFKNSEWNYYIESDGKRISKRYVETDLKLLST